MKWAVRRGLQVVIVRDRCFVISSTDPFDTNIAPSLRLRKTSKRESRDVAHALARFKLPQIGVPRGELRRLTGAAPGQRPAVSCLIVLPATSAIIDKSSAGATIGVQALSPSIKKTIPSDLPSNLAKAAWSP